jgi:hypothetical protein
MTKEARHLVAAAITAARRRANALSVSPSTWSKNMIAPVRSLMVRSSRSSLDANPVIA